MGRYFSVSPDDTFGPIGPRGCAGLPGGYVNDVIAQMCWAVTGQTIEIGDTAFSNQQGYECCNFNFRVDGSCCPAPFQGSLAGPIANG